MVSLRNSIKQRDGRFMSSYRSFQSTSLQLHHHQHKYLVVLKDLGSYRSAQIRIDYEVTIGNEYLMTHALSNYMSTATTTTATLVHSTVTEPHLSKRNKNNCYRYFALCSLCFWCASYLLQPNVVRCQGCKTQMIEFMPVRLDEGFLFQYGTRRRVSLHFLAW